MPDTYVRGDILQFPIVIEKDGAFVNPSNLFLTLRCEGQQKLQTAFPGIITRSSVGHYNAVIGTDRNVGFPAFGAGKWTWCYSSSDGFLVSGHFEVIDPCIVPSWLTFGPPTTQIRMVTDAISWSDQTNNPVPIHVHVTDTALAADAAVAPNFPIVFDSTFSNDAASNTYFVTFSVNDVCSPSDPASGITPHLSMVGSCLETNLTMPRDAASFNIGPHKSVADAALASDAATGQGPTLRLVGDTATAADAATGRATLSRSAADTAHATDAATRSISHLGVATDTANASDAVSYLTNYIKRSADAATASDAATRAASLHFSVTDTAHATDVVSRSVQLLHIVTDTAHASDALTAALKLHESVTDSAQASDSAIGLQTAVVDTALAQDSVTGFKLIVANVTDQALESDALAEHKTLSRSATDTAHASDALTAPRLTETRSVSDTAHATDAVTEQMATLRRVVTDSTTSTDAVTTQQATVSRSVSDTAHASDSATANVVPGAAQNALRLDVGTFNQATFLGRTGAVVLRLVADTANASDAATRVLVPAIFPFELDFSTLNHSSTFLGGSIVTPPGQASDFAHATDSATFSGAGGSQLIPTHQETLTTYSPVATDAFCQVQLTNSAMVTVTIDQGVFSAGQWFIIEQFGTGTVQVSPQNSNVVLTGNYITTITTGWQYARLFVLFEADGNHATITGDLGAT